MFIDRVSLKDRPPGRAQGKATIGPMAKPVPRLTPAEIQQVIEIAWHAPSPFDAVLRSHGLSPGQVVQLLKRELTPNAFKLFMARTRGPTQPGQGVAGRKPRRWG